MLFQKVTTDDKLKLKIFGITIFKRIVSSDSKIKMSILGFPLKVILRNKKEKVKFFNITLYSKCEYSDLCIKSFFSGIVKIEINQNKKKIRLFNVTFYKSIYLPSINFVRSGKNTHNEQIKSCQGQDQIRKNFFHQLSKVDIVSFDIFDTLLIRPYVEPTDVFAHLSAKYKARNFKKARIEAEERARQLNKYKEDITLDEIYEYIFPEYQNFKEKELKLEEKILTKHPLNYVLYEEAVKCGKIIIAVSDMYLPETFLKEVLQKNGYKEIEKVFVSSTYGKSKGGSLFDVVVKEMGVCSDRILHIGDNEFADIKAPEKKGLLTLLTDKYMDVFFAEPENRFFYDFYKNNNMSLKSSFLCSFFGISWMKKEASEDSNLDFWHQIGYKLGGPLAFSYVHYIAKTARKNRIESLLFVSRDGYILKKAYDYLDFADKARSYYIYAPRIMNLLCFGDYRKNPKYLESLLSIFYRETNKGEVLLSDDFKKNRKMQLNDFPAIKKWCEKKKNAYKNYLYSLNIDDKSLATVDMTTAEFSSFIFLRKFFSKRIKFGFFSGTFVEKKTFLYKTFFQKPFEGKDVGLIDLTELLISAPEFPICDFNESGPVFLRTKEEENRINVIKKIHVGIEKFLFEFKDFDEELLPPSSEVQELLKSFIQNISLREKNFFQSIDHTVDIQNQERRSLMSTIQSNGEVE